MTSQTRNCDWCGQRRSGSELACELCGMEGPAKGVAISESTGGTIDEGPKQLLGDHSSKAGRKRGVLGGLTLLTLLGLGYWVWGDQLMGADEPEPTPTTTAVASPTYSPPFPGVPEEATDCQNGTATTGKSSCEFAQEILKAYGAVPIADRPQGATVTLPAVPDPVRQSAFDTQCLVGKPTVTCFVGPEKVYIHAG